MKVGIITFSSAHNYGAMLQAYALQTAIEKMGFQVEIINFRPKVIDNVYNPFRHRRKGLFDLRFYKKKAGLHLKYRYKIKKWENFENFMKNNLNVTKSFKTFYNLKSADLDYDFYISGSDQIWNPEITKGLNPAYFLKFAPEKSKKITYAVSTGMNHVDTYDIPLFEHYLKNIDNISVREKSSVDSLSKCTDKSIDVVIDPTLLLERKNYDKIKKDDEFKNKDYIFVYALEYNEELIQMAEKISKKEKLPIIFNRPYKKFSNQMKSVPYIGPNEFLGAISNAKYVVTNSYHGVIFSIIYNKKFLSIPNTKTPSRMLELLNSLNLNQVLFKKSSDLKSISDLKIDYEDVENRLNDLKKKSLSFLEKSLVVKDKKLETKPCYLDTPDKFTCYGCYACKEICPTHSINMVEDDEGFFYPKIDEETCNNCKICENICIFRNSELLEKNAEFPKVFAGYNKNSEKRLKSSSGGLFLALSEKIINNGGYVIGATYDENMEVKHEIGKNLDDCKNFSGSKYVRSDISNILPEIKKLLSENKEILFVGVPCQVAGVKSYLKSENTDNLYLIEILCHSNPSPKVFKKYISYLEEKFESSVIDFKFKDKTMGWNNPSVLIKFENKESIRENARYNNYNRGFQTSLFARPCCYECEFVENNRVGDITIGDFWGIENIEPSLNDDVGTSLIILNNKKGKYFFDKISNELELIEENMEDAFKKNHKFPIILNKRRSEFFSKLDKDSINELLYSFNDVKKRHLKNKKEKTQSNKKINKNDEQIVVK